METQRHWEGVVERLAEMREESHLQHLLRNREAGVNLWGRLLPPLRRLEGWLERHAGRGEGAGQTGGPRSRVATSR